MHGILVNKRNLCVFNIALIMNIFGIMIAVAGLIIVNVMSFSYSCTSYSYSRITTTTATNSCNSTFNYVQAGLAAVVFICCIQKFFDKNLKKCIYNIINGKI